MTRYLDNVLLAHPHQKGEQIGYALTRVGAAVQERNNRNKALETLRFVGLADQAQDKAGELSYGQQKFLTLACCLATEAHTLLLDEPFAGVHPTMIDQLIQVLHQGCQEGRRIIFVEHDLASVRRIADLVIVLDQGRVIATGNADEVLKRPEIMEAYVA